MTIHIKLRGVTDHQSLQSTRLLVQTWQPYQLALDFFPIRKGINQEAIIAIYRSHQLTVATRSNPFPISGRNGETPFGVQRYFGSPTEHGICDELQTRTDRAFSALTHLLPLFSTFQHYIHGLLHRQQRDIINCCCTGT